VLGSITWFLFFVVVFMLLEMHSRARSRVVVLAFLLC